MSSSDLTTKPEVAGNIVFKNDHVLNTSAQVPKGKLISGTGGELALSADRQKEFAIIREGLNDHILMVDGASNAKFLDVRTRLRAQSDRQLIVYRVTLDILTGLYYKAPAKVTDRPKEQEHTAPEGMVHAMVSAASEQGASDIHIEARGDHAVILFRVHGIRRVYSEPTFEQARSLGQVMHGVYADAGSKDTTWNPSEPTDAALEWTVRDGRKFQLRFSSSPIHGGFHIVLRAIDLSSEGRGLDQLGYTKEQLDLLDMVTSSSSGMFLLCGATNSGKSTSLISMVRDIIRRRGIAIKVITVEDPVEAVVPIACQVPVPRRKSLDGGDESAMAAASFNKVLRGTLRQDPDVVMVGEIRDKASAGVVKDLVLAGRKLLSTLHANSAISAYIRLAQIDVDMSILTSPRFISGVAYQRLVRVLCPECSIRWPDVEKSGYSPSFQQRVAKVAKDLNEIRVAGPGCPRCKGSGIVGMSVCAEVLVPTRQFNILMAQGHYAEAEKLWVEQGGRPVLMHALEKMQAGQLSPVDVESAVGLLTGEDQ